MFFICKNIYFTKIARKGIHFLFNGKNVKQFCDVFMQKARFCTSATKMFLFFLLNLVSCRHRTGLLAGLRG